MNTHAPEQEQRPPQAAEEERQAPQQAGAPGKGTANKEAAPSQATKLVRLAEESYRLVQGSDGKAYAVDRGGPEIALPLRGRDGLRQRLARTFYAHTGTAPGGSALTDAMGVLEGMAAGRPAVEVALRVASYAPRPDTGSMSGQPGSAGVVLDLGDPTGRVVVIGPGWWGIEDTSPVLFRRTALTSALPVPAMGHRPRGVAALAGFRGLLNVDDAGFSLVVGWLLAALVPDIPHPILALLGEQGTAKSTAAKFCVRILDPSPAPLRSAPKDVKSWAVTAAASWTVALDNVSTIPAWFSDTLCKAVTGDGIVDRSLFTDDDVTVLSFRRVIALTSIDAGALAGDLAERMIPVELERIPPQRRRPDADVETDYRATAPLTLAGLLDLLAEVLAALPDVHLPQLPRMADFARLLAALDAVTGWTTLAAYLARAEEANRAVMEADPLATAVRDLLDRQAVGWSGTSTELLATLNDHAPDPRPRNWPKNASVLGGSLRRLAPALRASGIEVTEQRTGAGRFLNLRRTPPTDDVNRRGEEAQTPTFPIRPESAVIAVTADTRRPDLHKHPRDG
ncbi:hypothetical protein CLV92_108124 [Kineococcus xinjiangensis]|uniref:ATP-binding protein n=1 Tax=Kineococcus xinjiangensis TaxID=512762 RepID=A0A2S6IJ21_9ACTN|nr:ATP-binding protein [Kineococcus xinjiangensis]PPK94222.1 hypothetical protein CLV92_108124 [Kineococcus xinjiangensis]